MSLRTATFIRRAAAVALGLIAAVAVAVVAYRYATGQSEGEGAGADATIKVGGRDFIRWDTPRTLPAVVFADENGREVTLEQFRGRVVLLNVWATWCVPCRKEMPTLDRLQAKLGGPDFEVVALSIDQDGIAAVRKFYQEVGIKHLRIYNDPTADATARLNILGIPATLLVDRAGREVGRALGPAEWDAPDVIELIRAHWNPPSK
ncbi:MAG TPA: TlpA disulfide reductase family protein [Burkholderiales bacterium]|jgi:thiol-disulfide isomerase/thioredoxin